MKTKQGLLFGIAAMLFAAVCILSGCNDPNKDDSSPTVTGVTGLSVSPRDLSVAKGGTKQFTAYKLGETTVTQDVTWDIENSYHPVTGDKHVSETKIDSNTGLLTVAANEKTGLMLRIRATSNADPSKYGITAVTVVSSVTGVTVSPNQASVYKRGKQQFTASVAPPSASQEVTWSLDRDYGSGTSIDPDTGLLTVAADLSAVFDRIKVIATAKADTERTGEATASIAGPFPFPTMKTIPHDAHQLLNRIQMGETEVTQKEYKAVMNTNPSYHTGDNLPVEQVTWLDAVKFCNTLSEIDGREKVYIISGTTVTRNFTANGYRLPTEIEWEYTCRAGSTGDYCNTAANSAITDPKYAGWYSENSDNTTHTVKQMPQVSGTPTPNAFGLYDMHGNVTEWCDKSVVGTNNDVPVTRGGSYVSTATDIKSNATSGIEFGIDYSFRTIGFRVVCPAQ
jgi:hypothetical protein